MLLQSSSWQKKLSILMFLYIFFIIFPLINISKAEEITLTEEQKEQLQEAVKEQIKKMNEEIKKIKQQQKREIQEQTPFQQLTQQATNEPEWDGVYVVDNLGNYKELIPLSVGKVQLQRGVLTGKKYMSITLLPKEVNNVPWKDFKGFFFKGHKLTQEIIISKLVPAPFGKIFSFLSGMPSGMQYDVEDALDNLYTYQMKCKTKFDSSYCEFKDRDYIKQYLGKGKSSFCVLILATESQEKRFQTYGQAYAVCFSE